MTPRLAQCPSCNHEQVRMRNLKYAAIYRDTLECDFCDWQMSDAHPEFEAVKGRLFPSYFEGRCLAISPGALVVRVPARPDDPRR